MATEHDRFDEFAVEHVLGGLDATRAAEFRSHLTRCRHCRARVAELRDLASDLAVAEQDELQRARLKTEMPRRQARTERDEEAWRFSPRALAVIIVMAVLVGVTLAFWNFHLRDQNAELLRVTEAREQVLAGIATGRLLETRNAEGVTGVVAADETDVTLDLAGLPELAGNQQLVVWLLGAEPTDHYYLRIPAARVDDGRIALRDAHRGARELQITVEGAEVGDEPAGRRLLQASLPAS